MILIFMLMTPAYWWVLQLQRFLLPSIEIILLLSCAFAIGWFLVAKFGLLGLSEKHEDELLVWEPSSTSSNSESMEQNDFRIIIKDFCQTSSPSKTIKNPRMDCANLETIPIPKTIQLLLNQGGRDHAHSSYRKLGLVRSRPSLWLNNPLDNKCKIDSQSVTIDMERSSSYFMTQEINRNADSNWQGGKKLSSTNINNGKTCHFNMSADFRKSNHLSFAQPLVDAEAEQGELGHRNACFTKLDKWYDVCRRNQGTYQAVPPNVAVSAKRETYYFENELDVNDKTNMPVFFDYLQTERGPLFSGAHDRSWGGRDRSTSSSLRNEDWAWSRAPLDRNTLHLQYKKPEWSCPHRSNISIYSPLPKLRTRHCPEDFYSGAPIVLYHRKNIPSFSTGKNKFDSNILEGMPQQDNLTSPSVPYLNTKRRPQLKKLENWTGNKKFFNSTNFKCFAPTQTTLTNLFSSSLVGCGPLNVDRGNLFSLYLQTRPSIFVMPVTEGKTNQEEVGKNQDRQVRQFPVSPYEESSILTCRSLKPFLPSMDSASMVPDVLVNLSSQESLNQQKCQSFSSQKSTKQWIPMPDGWEKFQQEEEIISVLLCNPVRSNKISKSCLSPNTLQKNSYQANINDDYAQHTSNDSRSFFEINPHDHRQAHPCQSILSIMLKDPLPTVIEENMVTVIKENLEMETILLSEQNLEQITENKPESLIDPNPLGNTNNVKLTNQVDPFPWTKERILMDDQMDLMHHIDDSKKLNIEAKQEDLTHSSSRLLSISLIDPLSTVSQFGYYREEPSSEEDLPASTLCVHLPDSLPVESNHSLIEDLALESTISTLKYSDENLSALLDQEIEELENDSEEQAVEEQEHEEEEHEEEEEYDEQECEEEEEYDEQEYEEEEECDEQEYKEEEEYDEQEHEEEDYENNNYNNVSNWVEIPRQLSPLDFSFFFESPVKTATNRTKIHDQLEFGPRIYAVCKRKVTVDRIVLPKVSTKNHIFKFWNPLGKYRMRRQKKQLQTRNRRFDRISKGFDL